tara:strand:- start:789 stop:1814 length:1026 start_codon:yes stop_codon:yes gene_type:complete
MKKFILFLFITLSCKYLYSNSLFDTLFYEVDFISNDIESEKIKKIDEIKKKSISNLFTKILEFDQFKKINKILSKDQIDTLIKNIIINDEKIIGDKYIAKIKVNFDKKKIVNLLRKYQIPYVENIPNKFLLLIYEENNLDHNILSKNNIYYSFLNNKSSDYDLFKIPNLDINDRFILKKEDILNRNFNKILKLSNKYNLNEVIVIIAKNQNNKLYYNISLYSDDKFIEKELQFDGLDFDIFFKKIQNESINLWKRINNIQNTSLQNILCKINYFNILELKEIRNNINNISVIKKISIKKLSYRNIEYNILYFGDFKILNKLLNVNKLKVNNVNNECEIKLK